MAQQWSEIRPMAYMMILSVIMVFVAIFKEMLSGIAYVIIIGGYISMIVFVEMLWKDYALKITNTYGGIMWVEAVTVFSESNGDFIQKIYAIAGVVLNHEFTERDRLNLDKFYNMPLEQYLNLPPESKGLKSSDQNNPKKSDETDPYDEDPPYDEKLDKPLKDYASGKIILKDSTDFKRKDFPNKFKEMYVLADHADMISNIPVKYHQPITLHEKRMRIYGIEGFFDLLFLGFVENSIPLVYMFNSPKRAFKKYKEVSVKSVVTNIKDIYKNKVLELQQKITNQDSILDGMKGQVVFFQRKAKLEQIKADIITTEHFDKPDKHLDSSKVTIDKPVAVLLVIFAFIGVVLLYMQILQAIKGGPL